MTARNRKREDFLRASGRGLTVRGVELERVLGRIRSFHSRGMTYAQMEQQSNVHRRTVAEAVISRAFVKRSTWEALSRVVFEEPEPHAWVDPVGSRRRISALWAAGFPLPWLADELGFANRQYFQALIRGSKGVRGIEYANARKVAGLYDKLADADPAELGIVPRAATFARTFAAKKNCAPPSCWDADTIDDPDAQPEWTGACGTPLGREIHAREGIPVCERCRKARRGEGFEFSPDRLKEIRTARGYSAVGLARTLECDEKNVHRWEGGRVVPRKGPLLDRLLSVLDVTLEDICE